MSRIFDEVREEGALANSIVAAQRMLKTRKYSYDDIVEVSGLTIDEVKALDSKQTA